MKRGAVTHGSRLSEYPETHLWLLRLAPFFSLLSLWFFLTVNQFIAPLFLPSPALVFAAMVHLFTEENFFTDVCLSFSRVAGGFLLSAILAIPLGICVGTSRSVEAVCLPVIALFRYMPATAFIPLAILWFGIGFLQSLFLVFLSVFFYLVILVADAAANVSRDLVETALTLGANRLQVLLRVILRGALPDTWNALRTMFGVGWTMIVVVELVGAESGIGAKIIHAQRFLQTPKVIAGIIVIGLLGAVIDLMFRASYRMLFPWARL